MTKRSLTSMISSEVDKDYMEKVFKHLKDYIFEFEIIGDSAYIEVLDEGKIYCMILTK